MHKHTVCVFALCCDVNFMANEVCSHNGYLTRPYLTDGADGVTNELCFLMAAHVARYHSKTPSPQHAVYPADLSVSALTCSEQLA